MLLSVQRSIDATRIGTSDVTVEAYVFDAIAFAGVAAFMILLLLLVVDSALFEGFYWQQFEDSKLVSSFKDGLVAFLSSLTKKAERPKGLPKGRAGRLAASGSAAAKEQQKVYFNPMLEWEALAEASHKAGVIRSLDIAANARAENERISSEAETAAAEARRTAADLAKARRAAADLEEQARTRSQEQAQELAQAQALSQEQAQELAQVRAQEKALTEALALARTAEAEAAPRNAKRPPPQGGAAGGGGGGVSSLNNSHLGV